MDVRQRKGRKILKGDSLINLPRQAKLKYQAEREIQVAAKTSSMMILTKDAAGKIK